MGATDTLTKDYTDDCRIYADAFNHLLYGGRQVIRPEQLRPLDITAIGVPYGKDGDAFPAQRYRDKLKFVSAMEDGKTVITLVVLFSSEPWDGPMSLHEMLSVDDENILAFVPD